MDQGISQARSHRPHPIFWVIGVALVVIAAELALRPSGILAEPPALAQATGAGARGVFAFSGQLSKGTYGVFVVDTDASTIWAYEYLSQKGCLRLAGARSWRYDRYLENYNVCDLPPEAVEQMVEEQRQYRTQGNETAPAGPATKKKDDGSKGRKDKDEGLNGDDESKDR